MRFHRHRHTLLRDTLIIRDHNLLCRYHHITMATAKQQSNRNQKVLSPISTITNNEQNNTQSNVNEADRESINDQMTMDHSQD